MTDSDHDRGHDRDPDRDFDALLEAARSDVDGVVEGERRAIAPDFAAVVARAHELDPKAVPESAVVEAGSLAPVVELHEAEVEPALDEALEGLLADARELAELDVARRSLAGPPEWGAVAAGASGASDGPRPRSTGIAMVVALAAVLIGAIVIGPLLVETFVAGVRVDVGNRSGAEYLESVDEGARAVRPKLERTSPRHEPKRAITHDSEGADSKLEQAVVQADGDRPRPRPRKPALADRVAELDAEAQARWAAGDLDGARDRFEQIVRIGKRGRYADLAYGDLFTLARQRQDAAGERALWQAYLKDFPRGRFADDARAGLCRRASDGEETACWTAYLDDFPAGVHRRAAQRALGLEAE